MRGPSIARIRRAGFGLSERRGRSSGLGSRHGRLRIRLHVFPIATDPNIVWATCYGDEVTRWDARTKLARSVSPWLHTLDSPPTETKYRCHWTAPLAIDPFDHNTVYYGCQVIFRTTNGGQSWSVISPDLSTQDPKHASCRRAESSAIISASFTAKWCSRSRRRRCRRG